MSVLCFIDLRGMPSRLNHRTVVLQSLRFIYWTTEGAGTPFEGNRRVPLRGAPVIQPTRAIETGGERTVEVSRVPEVSDGGETNTTGEPADREMKDRV